MQCIVLSVFEDREKRGRGKVIAIAGTGTARPCSSDGVFLQTDYEALSLGVLFRRAEPPRSPVGLRGYECMLRPQIDIQTYIHTYIHTRGVSTGYYC